MRFSLSTYFNRYLSFSDQYIKLLYVDANLSQSVEQIVSTVESVSEGLPGTITIASISDAGLGDKRRLFFLFEAGCRETLCATEKGWEAALKKSFDVREKML